MVMTMTAPADCPTAVMTYAAMVELPTTLIQDGIYAIPSQNDLYKTHCIEGHGNVSLYNIIRHINDLKVEYGRRSEDSREIYNSEEYMLKVGFQIKPYKRLLKTYNDGEIEFEFIKMNINIDHHKLPRVNLYFVVTTPRNYWNLVWSKADIYWSPVESSFHTEPVTTDKRTRIAYTTPKQRLEAVLQA